MATINPSQGNNAPHLPEWGIFGPHPPWSGFGHGPQVENVQPYIAPAGHDSSPAASDRSSASNDRSPAWSKKASNPRVLQVSLPEIAY
jgi:hypothetical protein